MKKVLLLCAICFATAGISPAQSNHSLPKNYGQIKPITADTSITALLNNNKLSQKDLFKALVNKVANERKPESDSIIYSTMPVAGLSNRNIDLMPVAKLGNANTKYTMLVKRIGIAKPTLAPPADNQANADTDKK